MKTLRAILFFIAVVLFSVPLTTLIVLFYFFPMRWRIVLAIMWRFCFMNSVRWILGIDMDLRGQENIPPGPVIIMSKHQSAWETVAVQVVFSDRWLVFVLKRELLRLPFIGWALGAVRMISIDRAAGASAMEQIIEQGRNRLQLGYSIVVYPEGTRVAPGTRKRYKAGGARLAIETGYPVVPMAHNAGEFWPRNAFIKTPGTVSVRVGPPIDPVGHTPETLTKLVEDWIETEMQTITTRRNAAPEPAAG